LTRNPINDKFPSVEKIELTCYETNIDIIPLLIANLEFLKNTSRAELKIIVIKDNFYCHKLMISLVA